MATRYFIGTGNRNWNDTANWSLTSGGSGGASIPTSIDDVVFDANSGTGTITLNAEANCLSFTAGSLAGAITLSSSVNSINIYGSLTLPATNFTWTFTGTAYVYLKATTSVTLTMGATTGRTFNQLYFDGVGGTWTLQDQMNIGSGNFYFMQGTFYSNNQRLQNSAIMSLSANSTVYLESSDVYTGQLMIGVGSQFYAGTSHIRLSVGHILGVANFYEVTITRVDSIFTIIHNSGCTFEILRKAAGSGASGLELRGNITVNVLELYGNNSTNNRLLIASNTIGTPRTITCNGTIVAENVDFRDITIAGTADKDLSAIPGGSGDCGGNSGITFTPAVPQYYKHTGGGTALWSDAAKWFTDEALTIPGRVPLPQDDANFIAGSFSEAATLSVNCPRIGRSLNMEGVAHAVTMSLANSIECYGSYVLGENIIVAHGTRTLALFGRGIFSLKTYKKPHFILDFYNVNGELLVGSDILLVGGMRMYVAGVIDFNGFNSTIGGQFNLSSLGATFFLRNGIFTSTRSVDSEALFTFHLGTLHALEATLILQSFGEGTFVLFEGAGKHFNTVKFQGSYNGNYRITGANTFNELIIDSGKKVQFTAGTTQTIKKITANGTPAEPITITSVTAAQHTLNYTGTDKAIIRNANISYSNVTPSSKWYAIDSIDGGNNTGWTWLKTVVNKMMGFPLRLIRRPL